MLYCSTDRRCRRGAAVWNLDHNASFRSWENNAPLKSGIKHIRAGANLPHMWFQKSRPRHFNAGPGRHGKFLLLIGIGGEDWVQAALKLSPIITTAIIGPDRDVEDLHSKWTKIRKIDEAGCPLIRPDTHIAFRTKHPLLGTGRSNPTLKRPHPHSWPHPITVITAPRAERH